MNLNNPGENIEQDNNSPESMEKVSSLSQMYQVLKENDLSSLRFDYRGKEIVPSQYTACCGIKVQSDDKFLISILEKNPGCRPE